MVDQVIADTDVIIDFFSGIEPIASTVGDLIEKESLAITAMTVFELYAGLTGQKRIAQIDEFMTVIYVFNIGMDAALHAVEVYNDLKQQGKLIAIEDILIAGVCIADKRKLFTRNTGHFSRIKNLELWKKP